MPATDKKGSDKRKPATCFVIMPFSQSRSCNDWDNVYKNLIAPAIRASGFGYKPERSQIRTGAFIRDILIQLNSTSVVLADLTDMNPNVFYELGVRHTLKNRTILVAQDMKHVPSDLRAYGVVIYTPDLKGLPEFKRQLRTVFQHIEKEPDRPDNPVADYIKNRAYMLYEHDRLDAIRRLKSLHAEIFEILGTIGFNVMNFNDSHWLLPGCATPCLEELLATQYVNLSFEDYYRLRLLLMAVSDIDHLAKESLVHPTKWRKGIREAFFKRAADAEGRAREAAVTVQERISLLEKEDYTQEPPQPVQRAAIWETYLAQREVLAQREKKNNDAKKRSRKVVAKKSGRLRTGRATKATHNKPLHPTLGSRASRRSSAG